MNNLKIDLAVKVQAIALLESPDAVVSTLIGDAFSKAPKEVIAIDRELAELALLGNYSSVQMAELMEAIRSTPIGFSTSQTLCGVRNRTLEGLEFEAILDWLHGKESDRLPPSLQATFGN